MSVSHPSPRSALAGWLNDFDFTIRHRGRDYYRRGCVLELAVDSEAHVTTARAVVRGTEYYTTLLTSRDAGWTGACSCPVGRRCKHLYAVGAALLDRWSELVSGPADAPGASASPSPAPRARAPDDEAALVDHFTAATGAAPDRKQLAWLRHLLRLFHNIASRSPYLDIHALNSLLPASHRDVTFYYYDQPFHQRWAAPPATPLEFWSHLALVFTERGVPLPAFMAKLTDVGGARAAVQAHQRELALVAWRHRLAAVEAELADPSPADGGPATMLRHLRLRLVSGKPLWEISDPDPAAPESPAPPARFAPLPGSQLRAYLEGRGETAFVLEPVSTALAALLASRLRSTNRTAIKLDDPPDCEFLGKLLRHPLVSRCIVAESGAPIVRDPRRLIWQFLDHPTDPESALVRLAFADGTPAPHPLLHLPGKPALYLHGTSLFAGLPPIDPVATSCAEPAPIPRAALALPEAGRLAARAGLALPGDTSARFRRETLRPRLTAQLAPRRPSSPPGDEVLVLDLTALAPDGTPRARYQNGNWERSGPGLPPLTPDDAFLIFDFDPLRPAAQYFEQLPLFRDQRHPDGPRRSTEITSPHFPETFAAWLAGFPPGTAIELAPELAAFARPATRAHFALDLTPDDKSGIDWFDVRVTLRAEDTTLTPEEIALLHAARGRFVRLPGRGWQRLVLDDAPATREKLARLGLDPAAAEAGREPLRFHALQLADEALRDTLPEKLWARVQARSATLRALPAPTVPDGLAAELRPYQQEGLHFLAFLSANQFGGILADDMGLGKTLQTLAWLLTLAARPRAAGPFRALVVCPKSVVFNWQLETTRFAPALTTALFHPTLVASAPGTSGLSTSNPQLSTPAQLVIANYTQLRLHADAFASVAWDAVILDEGQNIKNPASATAGAARALRSTHRLVLTGTPVENRLLDLWSLFAFAQPGLLGGQTAFKRLYNEKEDPAGARSRLAQRVKHFLLRRTKSQVARDLPPRIEEDLVVELEGSQRALYDAELKRTRALLLGVKNRHDFDRQRFNILQSLLRLRQICCDPRLVGLDPAAPVSTRGKSAARQPRGRKARAAVSTASPAAVAASAKLEALLDTLEPLVAEGHKVLIFSQFVTMLELIRDELVARGIAHLLLTGQTENRQALVERFQSEPGLPVFLLSLKAAGAGLNLTAANYVVLFDPWWNPAVEAQAIDRTHRIGQRSQVIAYRLLARGTVEEKIRALQKEKAALAAAVVQEESLASVLDLESLRQILA